MKTYRVLVKEIHEQVIIVQANSKEEAVEMANAGEGLYRELVYIDALDDGQEDVVEEVEITIKEV